MAATKVLVRKPVKIRECGFCQSNNHPTCAVGTKDLQNRITLCLCTRGGCETGRRKCTECGNRTTEEVDPDTWQCSDVEACQNLVQTRRDSNPLVADIRRAKESARMAKVENAEKQAEKVAKEKAPTYCLVTGEETRGGLFKPGMDARYASNMVEAVTSGNRSEDDVLAQAKSDGVSEALQAKIAKGIRLAREKADKKAAAKAEKDAAKAASTESAEVPATNTEPVPA
jgi:hypothetical protein